MPVVPAVQVGYFGLGSMISKYRNLGALTGLRSLTITGARARV